jgi:hypothetical protein
LRAKATLFCRSKSAFCDAATTFKQWTARAQRCSIEATREATGGTMQTVAQRLWLTLGSLKSHLQRAKRVQKETLFDLYG